MKILRILYNMLEMFLFITASIYVTNEYIKSGSNLTMFFGMFLLLIFITHVTNEAKRDAVHAEEEQ